AACASQKCRAIRSGAHRKHLRRERRDGQEHDRDMAHERRSGVRNAERKDTCEGPESGPGDRLKTGRRRAVCFFAASSPAKKQAGPKPLILNRKRSGEEAKAKKAKKQCLSH